MRAEDYKGNLSAFLNDYKYQPILTNRLDNLFQDALTQEIINEIVLWKVNRYVQLDAEMLHEVNELRQLVPSQHRMAERTLRKLLNVRGIDLAMASTILRFRNPRVFQIIDQHSYRAIYDEDYPLYNKSPVEQKIVLYFRYVDDIITLCKQRMIAFESADRVLYKYDRAENGRL